MATLAELTAKVEEYTTYDDPDFIARIPDFIRSAEERVWFFVQLPNFQKTITSLSLALGVSTLALPADFLAAQSFAIVLTSGEYVFLLPKDQSYIREAYPTPATTGQPAVYAITGSDTAATNIVVGPTPSQIFSTQLAYFYKPASLVDEPTGTWLSNNAYDTLTYGTLSEAANYLKRVAGIDNMGDTYEQRFLIGLQGLKNLGESRDKKDTYRNGEKRMAE